MCTVCLLEALQCREKRIQISKKTRALIDALVFLENTMILEQKLNNPTLIPREDLLFFIFLVFIQDF